MPSTTLPSSLRCHLFASPVYVLPPRSPFLLLSFCILCILGRVVLLYIRWDSIARHLPLSCTVSLSFPLDRLFFPSTVIIAFCHDLYVFWVVIASYCIFAHMFGRLLFRRRFYMWSSTCSLWRVGFILCFSVDNLHVMFVCSMYIHKSNTWYFCARSLVLWRIAHWLGCKYVKWKDNTINTLRHGHWLNKEYM